MIPHIANTKISVLKLREPVRLPESATLMDAVIQLRERKRGVVLVEDDDGVLRGVFTERDLVTRVDHANRGWQSRAIRDCMTARPRVLDADATIGEAISTMQEGAFRNLPLVNTVGHATGVLTVRDILRYMAENFPQEFVNLPPDPRHEATSRWGG